MNPGGREFPCKHGHYVSDQKIKGVCNIGAGLKGWRGTSSDLCPWVWYFGDCPEFVQRIKKEGAMSMKKQLKMECDYCPNTIVVGQDDYVQTPLHNTWVFMQMKDKPLDVEKTEFHFCSAKCCGEFLQGEIDHGRKSA